MVAVVEPTADTEAVGKLAAVDIVDRNTVVGGQDIAVDIEAAAAMRAVVAWPVAEVSPVVAEPAAGNLRQRHPESIEPKHPLTFHRLHAEVPRFPVEVALWRVDPDVAKQRRSYNADNVPSCQAWTHP